MKSTIARWSALGLVIGLAIGAGLWGQSRIGWRRAVAADAANKRAFELAQLRTERERLRQEQVRLSAEPAGDPAPLPLAMPAAAARPVVRRAALATLAALVKDRQLVIMAGFAGRSGGGPLLLNRDGQLPPEFATLFELPPEKFEALQKAIEMLRQRAGEIAVAKTTAQRTETGAVVMEVKAAVDAPAVREQLRNAFTEVIGVEGVAAYEGLRVGVFDMMSRSFGLGDRTMTVERKGAIYRVREVSGNGRGGVSTDQWHTVEQTLGPLAKLVPPDLYKPEGP